MALCGRSFRYYVAMNKSIGRRTFLAGGGALAVARAATVRRELFRRAPGKGVAVMSYAFYTRPRGGEMLSIEQRWSRSDTIDVAYVRRSSDSGETWSEAEERKTGERQARGMLRRHPRCGFVDSRAGRYVEFWNEGILPSDDPLEGLRQWNIYYRVSRDGGRTFGPDRQIVHQGAEFTPAHALPGVWTGKNCAMLGDITCVPISAPDGRILLPFQITPLGPDGKLFNPGGGYTYTDAGVLFGEWQGDALQWVTSDLVKGDPTRSTRGMDEPTIEFLEDGRLLMVMRGSNDRKPELPSYRWMSFSSDGGRRWTIPGPWTYDDGTLFYSPSACSQLVRHSSGRLFWIGNITPENPRGNRPRYPLVAGEVDRRTGRLLRSSVQTVDTLQPGEDSVLSLSNFYAREDRRTREIAIHATRLFAKPGEWTGDSYLYRVRV